VSSALFGDGAAAAVVADGRSLGRRDAPVIVGHDGVTWPDTEDLMGWHFGDDGMTVQLSRRIPALVRREFRRCFEEACGRYGIDPAEVRHHLVHPGSGVVLDAVSAALDLPPTALDRSRAALREHGNMSAATVLFILDRFVRDGAGQRGDVAALSAMGPGFSADHVLLRC
jgi:alkylresorcinol/alkylpyrone synthase